MIILASPPLPPRDRALELCPARGTIHPHIWGEVSHQIISEERSFIKSYLRPKRLFTCACTILLITILLTPWVNWLVGLLPASVATHPKQLWHVLRRPGHQNNDQNNQNNDQKNCHNDRKSDHAQSDNWWKWKCNLNSNSHWKCATFEDDILII